MLNGSSLKILAIGMTIPPLPKSQLLGSLTEYGRSIFDPLKVDYVRSCLDPFCITLKSYVTLSTVSGITDKVVNKPD